MDAKKLKPSFTVNTRDAVVAGAAAGVALAVGTVVTTKVLNGLADAAVNTATLAKSKVEKVKNRKAE